MTNNAVDSNAQGNTSVDWQALLAEQAYVGEKPGCYGRIKTCPQDFKVIELMDVVPSGEGEHYWLKITKTRRNTEQVAKALAKFAKVPVRDVGYSGLKDFQAVTTQWFSVWKPRGDQLDWGCFEMSGVVISKATKHHRKLKRGAHRGNQFEIVVKDLNGDTAELLDRLERIRLQGVPNYFGVQRFGRGADNMRQACDMLLNNKRVKSRSLRGILISSARSWLFNHVVSQRVTESSWQTLHANEPANLDGSNSVFLSDGSEEESRRLSRLDIHPTAPIVGQSVETELAGYIDLHRKEMTWLKNYQELSRSLSAQGLNYQRRAIRAVVHDLNWSVRDSELALTFHLQPGQFATSVLRELVNIEEPKT